MSKILFDNELIKIMSLFTQITRVPVKDCFFDDTKVTFIIASGGIRQALGQGNNNLRKLEDRFRKKIRIVEFQPDLAKFIRNMILPCKVDDIFVLDDQTVILKSEDQKTKGLIIGKHARNLRALETNVRRYFSDLKEIKVE